jgi:hypothetical protein
MLAAIGEVAGESAVVDERLRDLFGLILGSPYAQIVVAGEDTARLIDTTLKVAHFHVGLSDEAVEQLMRLQRALAELRDERNFLVHAIWEKSASPGLHAGVRSRRPKTSVAGDTTGEYRAWTVDEVLGIATYYRETGEWLEKFIDETFDLAPYPPLNSRKRNSRIEKWLSETWGR